MRTLTAGAPDFTSGLAKKRKNSQLVTSILEGKGTAMPPWALKSRRS